MHAGVVALVVVSLFAVLIRPITRPTGPLSQSRGLTRWSLLAEAGSDDDHTPIAPPVHQAASILIAAVAMVLPGLLSPGREVRSVPPLRRRKVPPRRTSDSTSSH